ncbi:MAG: sigma-70 family RNA polymerase sigma factor [Clostridiales bacterium]|nr:sigma-70 family RNA polymerase sigma factor [Clostridiales bacterium]
MREGVNMDMETLVRRAKQGDKDALVRLIMDKQSDYYKLAFVYMRNKEDSLDAMADMIITLYEKIHQLKKPETFYSWSKTILVNRCKKLLKDRSKLVRLDAIKDHGCVAELKENEDKIILGEHLSKLNEKHREVIRLRYFLGLDYKTMSRILKIPVGTVKSRIHTGLKSLKKSLGGDGYERN